MLGADPSERPAGEVRAGDAVRPVVLVTPLAPQTGGNGLAMRAGMVLEALAGHWPVDLVIVPVSGASAAGDWAKRLARSVTTVEPVEGDEIRRHLTRQLADARLRARLEATAPLPPRAMGAPPTLAEDTARLPALSAHRPRAVFVLRGYLAPFGATLARHLQADRTVIDLDDDDERYARSIGADEEADSIGRLARAWLPDSDIVCVAAEPDAGSVAARYRLSRVVTLANAVRLPPTQPPPPPGDGRLLLVGNMTYEPNLEAARLLVEHVLPIVARTHPGTTVDLVGPHAGGLSAAASHRVHVHGMVEDLDPFYDRADIVVAPLIHGGGTRIKVLEAFAHRRPLVATRLAVAGLAVRDGHDVLLGDSPPELALALTALLDDPSLGARLADNAARTVAAHYVQNVVAPLVRELVRGQPVDPP